MSHALFLGLLLATPLAVLPADEPTGDGERPPSSRTVLASALPGRPAPSARPEFEVVRIRAGKIDLEGSWFGPRRKSAARVPGVLLIHDAGGDRNQLEALANRIHRQNLAVLTIDLRGHGGSKTAELDWLKMNEDGKKATWAFALADVDAAVTWLLGRENVHSTRLALVGHGAGCALVARHMLTEANGVAMALIEPPTEAYGFGVKKDILKLDGLPTRIIAAEGNGEKEVAALVTEARQQTTGDPVIDMLLAPPPVITNRAVLGRIAEFLDECANPDKGSTKRGG
ncbi:MAG: alpha/beta fold hydrolase [Planctomycetota bacterium]